MKRESQVVVAAVVLLAIISSVNFMYVYQLQGDIAELRRTVDSLAGMQDMMIKFAGLGSQMEEYRTKEALIKAAAAEGKLTVYATHTAEETMAYIDAFRKRYPFIAVDFYRAAGADMTVKYESEIKAGLNLPDVMIGTTGIHADFTGKGYLAEYVSPESKNYPDWALDKSHCFQRQRVNILFMMVNSKAFPDKTLWPSDWTDLANPRPEWTGLTSVNDGRATEMGYHIVYTLYKYLGLETTQRIFEGLKRTKPKLYTSMGDGANICVSGARPICTLMTVFNYATNLKAGAPLALILPKSGVPLATAGIGIFKKAPHPNAAKLFYDWFLSAEACEKQNSYYFTPLRTGMKPLAGVPSLDSFTPWRVDEAEMMAARPQLIANFTMWLGLG
jgi:iron(III) transport system substrate-binding protein